MTNSSFRKALEEALSQYSVIKSSPIEDVPGKVPLAETSGKTLEQQIVDLQGLPICLPTFFAALQNGNRRIIEAFKQGNTSYSDAEFAALKSAISEFEQVATGYANLEEAQHADQQTRALFAPAARIVIGILAVVFFIAGAVVASIGAGKKWEACTTLSYWLGFGAFVLASTWVASLMMWSKKPGPAVPSGKKGSDWQYQVFGGMAFLVLGLLAAGILTGGLLQFLSSVAGARGLITFLIAIGTIAIAIILTLASVLADGEKDEIAERLSKGKEILTVLVGVLGTIVGFYFANNVDGLPKMNINVVGVQKDVKPDGEFTIMALTTGGEIPYSTVPIVSVAPLLPGTMEGPTVISAIANAQGVISVTFKAPKIEKSQTFPVTIGLSDKSGQTATKVTEIPVVVVP
jgi:hypothetical protein